MQRVLTIVVPIIIAFAVIGVFVFGLMQRLDIAAEANPPVVLDADGEGDVATTDSETMTAPIEGATVESAEEPTTAVTTATENTATENTATETTTTVSAPVHENLLPLQYDYELIGTFPHDRGAFLQGLVWEDGVWYEGTGLRGQSTLRKVEPETGEVLQQVELDDSLFGEGITIFEDRIYQLTWQAKRGFIYDKESFELLEEFSYPTEGWGITHDGEQLIMSDGSATIYFLDPVTLEQINKITVTNQGQPVENLNELEYIDGLIYANVWQTPFIMMINPETGHVEGLLKLDDLLTPADKEIPVDVLNGIAYDADADRLFVTGKLWPKIFEIKLVPPLP